MTKNNGLAFGEAAFVAEPRRDFFARHRVGDGLWSFTKQIEFALAGAVAHAGEVIGNHA